MWGAAQLAHGELKLDYLVGDYLAEVTMGILAKTAREKNGGFVQEFCDRVWTPLGETLGSGDSLLFAYTNLEGSGARHLAIAGRDAEGRVHWYHPAFRSEEERPESLAIEQAADRELSEAIRAEHAVGSLEICALFSDAPLSIPEVDRKLEAGGGWPEVEILDCRRVTVR